MSPNDRSRWLIAIKTVHTAIWLFFVVCIATIPIAGAAHQFQWAIGLAAVVLVECAILAINRGHCPLSGLAGRFTDDRFDGFDIYLPRWLARYNSIIFGALFAAGLVFDLGCWLLSRR